MQGSSRIPSSWLSYCLTCLLLSPITIWRLQTVSLSNHRVEGLDISDPPSHVKGLIIVSIGPMVESASHDDVSQCNYHIATHQDLWSIRRYQMVSTRFDPLPVASRRVFQNKGWYCTTLRIGRRCKPWKESTNMLFEGKSPPCQTVRLYKESNFKIFNVIELKYHFDSL